MKATIWVARLLISDAVARKIIHKHKVEAFEVEDAVLCVRGLAGAIDPDHPGKYVVDVVIRGRPHVVVLFRAAHDHDTYHLASAFGEDGS